MRAFDCSVCGQVLVFENSVCVSCGTNYGFDPRVMDLVPVPVDGSAVTCANLAVAACTWLVPADEVDVWNGLCACCRLTRTRPADTDVEGLAAFARTEQAKRRLVYQLLDLGMPVAAQADDLVWGSAVPPVVPGGRRLPDGAPRLAFDLLSSAQESVITGHADGVVTIDLAEGEDAHREAMRVQMGEPYRTLLGHLRHEVGHYYWQVLVGTASLDVVERFRSLFGDERADYGQALQRHYGEGAPSGWQETHVSAYATAHPHEDWAETFAHYLHIRDTLQTAAAFGMLVTGPDLPGADHLVSVPVEAEVSAPDGGGTAGVHVYIDTWLPLTFALNAVNRSMGKDDLYPFLLTQSVIAKLGFVHDMVTSG